MNKSTPIQLPLAIEGETVEIPLTRGYIAVIDAIDGDLLQLSWSVYVTPNGTCYAIRHKTLSAPFRQMHKKILERILGRPLVKGEECDHQDLNPLNNRRTNLRLATRKQNGANRSMPSHNTSGLKGASYSKEKRKWRAQIRAESRSITLGYFETAEEAHRAYCEAAVKYFGEFARFE